MGTGLELNIIFAYGIGLILLYVLGWLLVVPLKLLLKLVINGFIGGIALILFNLLGGVFHLNLAISPLNALITGFLGIPGLIVLLIAQRLL